MLEIPNTSGWNKIPLHMLSGWWFGTWILFSISYMGCHPSHWLIFFKMVIALKTTNQKSYIVVVLAISGYVFVWTEQQFFRQKTTTFLVGPQYCCTKHSDCYIYLAILVNQKSGCFFRKHGDSSGLWSNKDGMAYQGLFSQLRLKWPSTWPQITTIWPSQIWG